MPKEKPWEQQPDEGDTEYGAFRIYLLLHRSGFEHGAALMGEALDRVKAAGSNAAELALEEAQAIMAQCPKIAQEEVGLTLDDAARFLLLAAKIPEGETR